MRDTPRPGGTLDPRDAAHARPVGWWNLDTDVLFAYGSRMDLKLTAEIHRDGEWFVGFCQEVPEANGQGRTPEECLQSLKDAVLLLMEDRREDARSRLAADVRVLELA